MALLNQTEKTEAERIAERVDSRINNAFEALSLAIRQSVIDIYGDPSKTQAIFDAWGTAAVKRFVLSNVAVEAINAAKQVVGDTDLITVVIPSDHQVTINPDGTATDVYTPTVVPPMPEAPVVPTPEVVNPQNNSIFPGSAPLEPVQTIGGE